MTGKFFFLEGDATIGQDEKFNNKNYLKLFRRFLDVRAICYLKNNKDLEDEDSDKFLLHSWRLFVFLRYA